MKDIAIGPYQIGLNHPPFLVAEISVNHNHSLERALKLVEAAKHTGVQAIKIQTYTPDTLTLDIKGGAFLISDPHSLWYHRNLYELYQEAYLPWEWHEPIFKKCRELGLVAFSSPFDSSAVEFLETLDVPCYKIASPEIVDHALIAQVAKTGKPIILSTGAALLGEIEEAVNVARNAGCRDLILLKCTAAYPAKPQDMNLCTLPHLSAAFDCGVGLSDHTLGIGVAVASVALGAVLIEKHFTLSRSEGGPDSAFSVEPAEFKQLAQEARIAWEALGKIHYAPLKSEHLTHSHRPSLYFVEDLPEGTILQPQHIRSVRPGAGLPPKEADHLIGMALAQAVQKGTPVQWEAFKDRHAP